MSLNPTGFTPGTPPIGSPPSAASPPAPNPLLSGTPPVPRAGVTLAEFNAATRGQRVEFLDLVATTLATTPRGEPVRGTTLPAAGGASHTIILSAGDDETVDVTALDRSAHDRLDGRTRGLAMALGAYPGAALGFALRADELRAMTQAGLLAHVTARATALDPGGTARGLTAADGRGTATFLLAPSGGVMEVGRLRFSDYHALDEPDRDAARATGALDLRAGVHDMRSASSAIAKRHIAEFGVTLGTTAAPAPGVDVRGVTLPGPSIFLASASGGVIDVAGLSFSDYHALTPADLARVVAVGGREPVPTPAELRDTTPARRLDYVKANAITLDTLPDGTQVRGLAPRSSAWTDPFVLSADATRVIDAARLTDAEWRAFADPRDRAIAAAAGAPRALPTATGFLALSAADRLALLERNAVVLALLPGGGEVRGLRLGDPTGGRTFALVPGGGANVALDVTAIDLPGFYALGADARAAVQALGAPSTITPAQFDALGAATKRDAIERFGRPEDAGGTKVPVLRLNGPGGPRTLVVLPAAGPVDLATMDLDGFYGLTVSDRTLANALGAPALMTAARFDALGDAAKLDAIARFGRVQSVNGSDVTILRLPDPSGQRGYAAVDDGAGPAVREVAARGPLAFYQLPPAARILAAALGVPRTPALNEAQFTALSAADKLDAIARFGRGVGVPDVAGNGPKIVPVLEVADAAGEARRFAAIAGSGGQPAVTEVTARTMAEFLALAPAARDVATATGARPALTLAAFNGLNGAEQVEAVRRFGTPVEVNGSPVSVLRLRDGAAVRSFAALGPSPAGATALTAQDLASFYALPSDAARDVAAALGMPAAMTAAQFDALGDAAKLDAIARFGSPLRTDEGPVNVLRLPGPTGPRAFARTLDVNGVPTVIEGVRRTFDQYSALPTAEQRAIARALAPQPPIDAVTFNGLSNERQIEHVRAFGTLTATSGGTVPVLRLAAPADMGRTTMGGMGRTLATFAVADDASGNPAVMKIDGIGLADYHALPATQRGIARSLGAPGPITPAQFDALTAAQRTTHVAEFGVPTLTGAGSVPVLRLTDGGGERTLAVVDGTLFDLASTPQTSNQTAVANTLNAIAGSALPPPYLRRDADTRIAEAKAVHSGIDLDGLTRKLANNPLTAPGVPAQNTAEFRTAFLQAHTAHQLEWLHLNGGANGVAIGPGLGDVRVMLSVDGKRVINVDALTLGAISSLSLADQQRLTGVPGFVDLALRLGVTTKRAAMEQRVRDLRNTFNDPNVRAVLPSADQNLFLDQLATIETRLQQTAIFSEAALAQTLTAIDKRHKRMSEFHKVLGERPNPNTPSATEIASADAGLDVTTIRQGYDAFRREEARIRNIDQRIAQVSRLAQLGVPTLDVPALIVELQSLYEIKSKASADADTVELEQQNALLRDYAAMQNIVNQTSSLIDPKEPEERRGIVENVPPRLRSMFSRTEGTVAHPIEVLTGASRPKVELRVFEWQGPKNDGRTNDAINGFLVDLFDEWGANTMPPAFRQGGRYGDLVRLYDKMPKDNDNVIHLDEKQKSIVGGKEVDDFSRRPAATTAMGLKSQPNKNFFANLDNNFVAAFKNASGKGDGLQNDQGIKQIWVSYLFEKKLDGPNDSDFEPQGFRETYGVSMRDIWDESDPAEKKIYRPELRKDQWDGYSTRLAEVVTTINQSNQLRQNAISQAERQANRHFDVVSNTLKRMFDLNQAIGRNAA